MDSTAGATAAKLLDSFIAGDIDGDVYYKDPTAVLHLTDDTPAG